MSIALSSPSFAPAEVAIGLPLLPVLSRSRIRRFGWFVHVRLSERTLPVICPPSQRAELVIKIIFWSSSRRHNLASVAVVLLLGASGTLALAEETGREGQARTQTSDKPSESEPPPSIASS